MRKIGNIYVGSKYDLDNIPNGFAIVHACKTSHQKRLGYTKPIKDSPYYIIFYEGDELYINWVDEPTGRFFKVETFIAALNFIENAIKSGKEVFVHCDQGESRAPTLAMVFLAKRTDFLDDNFQDAVKKFEELYPEYRPSGILKFVERHWSEIQ